MSLGPHSGRCAIRPFPPMDAGHLWRHASHSRLHLLGGRVKYSSNVEIVFLAVLLPETEIKFVVGCRATGVD